MFIIFTVTCNKCNSFFTPLLPMQNGSLTIVDRKKHIFKLQQGEYVAPEKIENIYLRSPYIAQIFVHGDSLKVSVLLLLRGFKQH